MRISEKMGKEKNNKEREWSMVGIYLLRVRGYSFTCSIRPISTQSA